jgi:hypothetical protein
LSNNPADNIMEHYTHLTKDDAYDAMIRVLTVQRG